MTVTTNEYGQNNLFAKEPQMVVEDYNKKGLFSPMQYREMYNGRWAMMGIVSGLLSYAITGKLFFGIFWRMLVSTLPTFPKGLTMKFGFTPEAEILNARAAMLGFVIAVGTYITTGQIIPGVFWC